MRPEALPLALLTLLIETTVGGVWVLLIPQVRKNATPAFIKFTAVMIFVMAAITFFVGAAISVGNDVDGYPLDNDWMSPVRVALAATFAASALYAYATYSEHRTAALGLGAVTSICGFAALAFLAAVLAPATWGVPLVLVSLVVSAIAVGAVSNGMILGHWYLVTPRLSEAPLREVTGLLVLILVVQAILIGGSLALPHDTVATSYHHDIWSNPFFWMRVGFGLVFPAVLAWMAYDSAGVRAMQSSTGLLYIAMVLVWCAGVVAIGVLCTSGVPN
ncbi:MAG: hypothetical protein ABI559_04620 [Chloroflexota bacterium]